MKPETNGHKSTGYHKGARRRYSDKERAAALAALTANAGNVLRTSRDTGIPRKTLELWGKEQAGGNLLPGVADECQGKKEELSAIFERVARIYLKHAEGDEIVAETKGKDAIIAAATATDKHQLLEGKPTQIQGGADFGFDERIRGFAKKYGYTLAEAKAKIVEEISNPAAIAALDKAFPPLASDKEQ